MQFFLLQMVILIIQEISLKIFKNASEFYFFELSEL